MKKALLCLLVISSLPIVAQTEQGRILLGGSVGFGSNSSERLDTTDKVTNTSKYSNLGISLRGGYFVADNLAAGLLISYANNKNSFESPGTPPAKTTDDDTYNETAFGLFGRYYTPPTEGRFSFFGQLDLTYFAGKNVSETNIVNSAGVTTSFETHDDTKGFGAMLVPGVAFFLSDLVALEATFGQIGFRSSTTESFNTSDRLTHSTKNSEFDFVVSPSSLRLGISFYIGGGGGSTK